MKQDVLKTSKVVNKHVLYKLKRYLTTRRMCINEQMNSDKRKTENVLAKVLVCLFQ